MTKQDKLILALLTLGAAGLYAWGVARGGGHFYYSAAARTMGSDWQAFLFGAFDPARSITIDKAAGGLWAQALSVRLLGFHTWTLLLPGALATTATVPLLYGAVRRWAGTAAAAIAGGVFALSPVTFAAMRVNLADSVLVCCLAAAAYLVTRAFDDDRFRWPLAAAVLVGVAFQVKMIEAWLVLPALTAGLLARRRFAHAAAFAGIAAAASLSWLAVVSLIPPGERPFVDGSTANSYWQLVFGYNGVGRTGGEGSALAATAAPYGGAPGPFRLVNDQLGGQIGWLLPLALVVLAACWWRNRRDPGWALWGTWLVTAVAVFSTVSGLHPYYATLAVPALAAVVGAGVHATWRRGWVFPAGIALSATAAAVVTSRVSMGWLTGVIIGLAAVALALWRTGRRPVAVLAAAAVLAGPVTWIAVTPPVPRNSMHSANPVAGPQTAEAVFGNPDPRITLARILGIPPTGPTPPIDAPLPGADLDPHLLSYLRSNWRGERYLFATGDAATASPYIAEGWSVLPMGGFTGFSPYPTESDVAALVHTGQLRYLYIVTVPGLPDVLGRRADWANRHCRVIPRADDGAAANGMTLFDCAGAR